MADSQWSEWKENTLRAKPKVYTLEEKLQKWKEHFQNLLGNPQTIMDKITLVIINCQADIELEQYIYIYI